ncbi:MAG: hypothetical protein L6R40_001067 [Gallowayella cf. fulva]|nr:MAG: hypothetical protein L6R40_001067 [Xanthomendoza cf. fulva]
MEREQTTDLMLGHSEQLDVAALLCRLKQPTKKMLSTSRCQPKVMHHGPQQEEEIMTSKTKRTPRYSTRLQTRKGHIKDNASLTENERHTPAFSVRRQAPQNLDRVAYGESATNSEMDAPGLHRKIEQVITVEELPIGVNKPRAIEGLIEPLNGEEITYSSLPKIPLRVQSLLFDFSVLGHQFFDTVAVLKLLITRKISRRQLSPRFPPYEHQIIHLYTIPGIPMEKMSRSLMLDTIWEQWDIPLIFPIANGVYELLVRCSYLDELVTAFQDISSTEFRRPTTLPKGMVGRAAQMRSVALPNDAWVTRIYLELLEEFPWKLMMKDTAESMSIHHSSYATIGSRIYEL